ncbi:MAG: TRAP transporter small permease [Aestuariivita sp.]|nr:TRAP transporter small permease [Aestuariivita sp.]
MVKSLSVLEDRSPVSRIDLKLMKLERVFAMTSGLAIFGLIIMAVISVAGRNLFNRPLIGYVDWVETAMPLIAFMGVAYVQREGAHIRMDMFVGQLNGRLLWLVELVGVILIFLFMAALVWGSWAHFERSFDWNAPFWSRDSTIDIGIPLWPAKILAPIAFGLLCLRTLIQIWGYAVAFFLNIDRPAAVPLAKDIAKQVVSETDYLSGEPK